MNFAKNSNESVGVSDININVNSLSLNELRQIRDVVNNELEKRTQKHINTIRAAIKAVQEDGLEIHFGTSPDYLWISPYDDFTIDICDNN